MAAVRSRGRSSEGVDVLFLPEATLQVLLAQIQVALCRLETIERKVDSMSKAVDDLVAEVARVKTVGDSTKALLQKLFAIVQGAIDTGDMAKVQQAVSDLKAESDDLAKAVTDNTPAAGT